MIRGRRPVRGRRPAPDVRAAGLVLVDVQDRLVVAERRGDRRVVGDVGVAVLGLHLGSPPSSRRHGGRADGPEAAKQVGAARQAQTGSVVTSPFLQRRSKLGQPGGRLQRNVRHACAAPAGFVDAARAVHVLAYRHSRMQPARGCPQFRQPVAAALPVTQVACAS